MLEELSDILGKEGTFRLLSRLGGLKVYIPKKHTHQNELSHTIGPENAEKLILHFGGETLQVPMGRNYLSTLRKHTILQLKADGHSTQEIARQVGCSLRYVYVVLKDAKSN